MSYSSIHIYIFKGQLQNSVCFPLMCYLMGKIIMNQIGFKPAPPPPFTPK